MTDEQLAANVTVYRCPVKDCGEVIAMVPPGFDIDEYDLNDRVATHAAECHGDHS